MNRNATFTILAAVVFTAISCSSGKKDYDATGTFEATEVTVSAEQNGRLVTFTPEEGQTVKAGQQVGLIDTVQLWLKARQAGATRQAYADQRPDAQKQMATLRQQLAKARQEQSRFEALVRDNAAGSKQLDDAKSTVLVLQRQLDALEAQLGNSTRSLNSQMSAADIQRMMVVDQLQKCHIESPIAGTVIEKFAEQGEFAAIGKPLFKVADMERMYLRAYVTTSQLQNVKLGQPVTVFADYGSGNRREYRGTVSWISARSEFTPKTILTDDERADLVYAVKIAVKNDGYIKIGMYGEVKLQAQ